jgi:hypothetical protein
MQNHSQMAHKKHLHEKFIFRTVSKRPEFSGTKTVILQNKAHEKNWDSQNLTDLLKEICHPDVMFILL